MRKIYIIQFILSLLTILLGCASKASIPKEALPGISKLSYHFQDSSEPPEYHRSYTIEITDKSYVCIVDSYGDIISSKQNIEQSTLLSDFENILATNEFERCDKPFSSGDGCTSGTRESLSIIKNGKTIFNEQVYHCGGINYGKLCGGILNKIKDNLSIIKCK